ncbi:testis-expressed protein 47 isoform X1 [Narcine bancroftii]|uniref:testis-expressed protein 47 isoform X1 n=1 Tax=Narcine bancroftii TaxID=1343680 RepID=UPI003831EC10
MPSTREAGGKGRSKGLPRHDGASGLHRHLERSAISNTKEESRSLLHRLVLVSKISPDLVDTRELGGYYETLFQKLQRCHQGDMITGLLMVYPNYVVHVIEQTRHTAQPLSPELSPQSPPHQDSQHGNPGTSWALQHLHPPAESPSQSSSDVLCSVIRDLREMQRHEGSSFCRSLYLKSKILVMSHNIPSRLFPQWGYHDLKIPAKQLDDNLQREPIEKIVSESLPLLLKLGLHLQKIFKEFPNCVTHSVLDDVPELIIRQNWIACLVESNELLTPAQFLYNYSAPFNTIMDSEFVWPAPEHILPAKRK